MFASVSAPWPRLVDTVREELDKVVVSHRENRKLAGPLHGATLYGNKIADESGRKRHHIRRPLTKLNIKKHLIGDDIVDPVVRKAVQVKYNELCAQYGKKEPKDLFASAENHPYLTTKRGQRIPIHKVRVFESVKAEEIGSGARRRYVVRGHDVDAPPTLAKRARFRPGL